MSGGPFSGLFRGSPREQPHHLDLSGSAFVAWDDNPLASGPNGNAGFGTANIKPGVANGYQGTLNYGFHRSGNRSDLTLNGNGSLQEFESSTGTSKLFFQSYAAGAGLRTNITPKISISFTGNATYLPYYQYAPFLASTATTDSPVGADYGYATKSEWVRTTSGTVSVEDRFTKRSSISGTVSWNQQLLQSSDLTIETETAGMRFGHNITKKLVFYIGYGVSQSQYSQMAPGTEPVRYGNIDVGLGYGDGLTFRLGRSTTVNLNVGASIAKNGDPASVVKTGRSTVFLVNGSATLSRSLGRAWGASIGYTRGTSYVVGFTEPFNTDALNAGLGGPVVSRLFFSLGAGASRGQQVFTQEGTLIAYTGSAKLTFGLFTNLGLYAQASYYKYDVPASVLTAFSFMPQLERRSISAGVTTWLPLIKPPRARRVPNDQQAEQQ
jgi:hypothetical protein